MEKELKKPVRLSVKVSAELNDWLDKRSFETAISKSSLVALAVENYRKEVETITAMPEMMEQLKKLGIDPEQLTKLSSDALKL